MADSVLVTGASGFVGTALAQNLIEEGKYHVVSMVRDRTREAPGHTVVYGDIRDGDFCHRVVADYNIRMIYHLAAQAIVSTCAEDPITAIDVAAMGTARLLRAVCAVSRPIRVIVSTSDKVYGSAVSPYTEETPLSAEHAYEVSKACQDLIARMYHANYGLDVCVVRAVNIYGPNDPNKSRVVPQTILRLLRGEKPLLHAGAHSMRRQYVYIDDLVAAFKKIAYRGAPGEAYCVGAPDSPLSVAEVIERIARQFDRATAPEVRERPAHFIEIEEQAICDDKLRGLDWTPHVRFDEGIQRTIAWYQAERQNRVR